MVDKIVAVVILSLTTNNRTIQSNITDKLGIRYYSTQSHGFINFLEKSQQNKSSVNKLGLSWEKLSSGRWTRKQN